MESLPWIYLLDLPEAKVPGKGRVQLAVQDFLLSVVILDVVG
jgi:hypothetical protein